MSVVTLFSKKYGSKAESFIFFRHNMSTKKGTKKNIAGSHSDFSKQTPMTSLVALDAYASTVKISFMSAPAKHQTWPQMPQLSSLSEATKAAAFFPLINNSNDLSRLQHGRARRTQGTQHVYIHTHTNTVAKTPLSPLKFKQAATKKNKDKKG